MQIRTHRDYQVFLNVSLLCLSLSPTSTNWEGCLLLFFYVRFLSSLTWPGARGNEKQGTDCLWKANLCSQIDVYATKSWRWCAHTILPNSKPPLFPFHKMRAQAQCDLLWITVIKGETAHGGDLGAGSKDSTHTFRKVRSPHSFLWLPWRQASVWLCTLQATLSGLSSSLHRA